VALQESAAEGVRADQTAVPRRAGQRAGRRRLAICLAVSTISSHTIGRAVNPRARLPQQLAGDLYLI